ncbi:MAG: TMEM175 family protein [Vulcanimicrobiaceae bacterium]
MSKQRFDAFSDGVFAFAVTLLILGVVLPEAVRAHASDAALTQALLGLWPSFAAYLLSFAVIGVMWQSHHALFRLVETIDRTTVFWNLGLLCVVAFIPFATSVLGAYPIARPATVLYGLTLTSSAICYNLMLRHLMVRHAFRDDVMTSVRATARAFRVGLTTYALATLVAFVAPTASFALYLLIVAYFLVPRGVDADLG